MRAFYVKMRLIVKKKNKKKMYERIVRSTDTKYGYTHTRREKIIEQTGKSFLFPCALRNCNITLLFNVIIGFLHWNRRHHQQQQHTLNNLPSCKEISIVVKSLIWFHIIKCKKFHSIDFIELFRCTSLFNF